jgi:hypothetical protein
MNPYVRIPVTDVISGTCIRISQIDIFFLRNILLVRARDQVFTELFEIK